MVYIETWEPGCENQKLWVDFTTLLAEYFTVHKNPLTRFDMSHLFNFWGSMHHHPAGVLVAYERGKPVGMVMIEVMKPRKTRPYGHEISRLYVKDSARGRGIGVLLMRAAFARLQDAGQEYAFLLVDTKNTPAVKMYERMGFLSHPEASQEGTDGVLYLDARVDDLLAQPEPQKPSGEPRRDFLGRLLRSIFAIPQPEVVK